MDTLLEAFASLARSDSYLQLLVIGGGANFVSSIGFKGDYTAYLHSLAKELGIADRVTWTGYCSTWEPTASMYLRASDVCVLPYDTGVSLNKTSVATALAHGLPLITTRGPFSDPEFVDGKNVLFCPPKDANALAMAIERLLSSQESRGKLSEGARELYEERFSWDRVVEQTLKVYAGAKASTSLRETAEVSE